MKKVKEIRFDEETSLPVYILEDGTKRVPYSMPTGNCWVTYWITPAKAKKYQKDAKEAEEKWMQDLRQPKPKKKRWWKLVAPSK
jgi:hypothetical protein